MKLWTLLANGLGRLNGFRFQHHPRHHSALVSSHRNSNRAKATTSILPYHLHRPWPELLIWPQQHRLCLFHPLLRWRRILSTRSNFRSPAENTATTDAALSSASSCKRLAKSRPAIPSPISDLFYLECARDIRVERPAPILAKTWWVRLPWPILSVLHRQLNPLTRYFLRKKMCRFQLVSSFFSFYQERDQISAEDREVCRLLSSKPATKDFEKETHALSQSWVQSREGTPCALPPSRPDSLLQVENKFASKIKSNYRDVL